MTSVEIPTSVAAALPTLCVFDITNDVSRELVASGITSGLAHVSPEAPLSMVRVTERESGFFTDLESMLTRLVPQDVAERERLLLLLLGPAPSRSPSWKGSSASASGSACCCSASTGTRARTTR